jgi:hypothetical protein
LVIEKVSPLPGLESNYLRVLFYHTVTPAGAETYRQITELIKQQTNNQAINPDPAKAQLLTPY